MQKFIPFKSLLIVAVVILSGCHSESPIEKVLRENIEQKEANLNYKLISCTVVDTIDVGKRIAELVEVGLPLQTMGSNMTKEKFEQLRNQEFKEFRSDTTYERKVMTGELKDASEWCTEIRERTEYADSVLSNWDSIDKTDWKFISAIGWYNLRAQQFYYNNSNEWLSLSVAEMEENKPTYIEYISLKDAPMDSVIYLAVEHKYKIYNPIVKDNVELCDSVTITTDNKIVSIDNKTDFVELFNKLIK